MWSVHSELCKVFLIIHQGCSKLFHGGVAKVYISIGESGGMLPQENFEEIASEAIFRPRKSHTSCNS